MEIEVPQSILKRMILSVTSLVEPLLWEKSSRKLVLFSGDLVVYKKETSFFVELMDPNLNMFSMSVHLVKDYFK